VCSLSSHFGNEEDQINTVESRLGVILPPCCCFAVKVDECNYSIYLYHDVGSPIGVLRTWSSLYECLYSIP
jgi:hypothetical protein